MVSLLLRSTVDSMAIARPIYIYCISLVLFALQAGADPCVVRTGSGYVQGTVDPTTLVCSFKVLSFLKRQENSLTIIYNSSNTMILISSRIYHLLRRSVVVSVVVVRVDLSLENVRRGICIVPLLHSSVDSSTVTSISRQSTATYNYDFLFLTSRESTPKSLPRSQGSYPPSNCSDIHLIFPGNSLCSASHR